MNSPQLPGILGLAHVALMLSAGAWAQDGKTIREPLETGVVQTERDFSESDYAARARFAPHFRALKLDLDADFSSDGEVDNEDRLDNGPVQKTPPGLILGRGDLQKAVIRAYRYPKNYRGELRVAISVEGINRREKSGDFASVKEEIANSGGIRVWLDREKTHLLIDSRDPGRRAHSWDMGLGFPSGVPTVVFVEGVVPSQFSGDVRLIVSALVVDRKPKDAWAQYDHILLTVEPHSLPEKDNGTTYFAAGRSAANK